MSKTSRPAGSVWLRTIRRGALAIAAPLALSACGDLFDVDNPVDILEEDLGDPRVLAALSNSAEGAVAEAYDLALAYGELPGDGAVHISTNQGNLALDRGSLADFNERAEQLYNEMASARWTATEVTRRLEALVKEPSRDAGVGRSYFWDALARITLADLHEEVPFDGGPPNTPAQVYEMAIPLLQKAAAVSRAAGQAEYAAAAHGTMARAYRSLYFERKGDMAMMEKAREAAEQSLREKGDFRVDARYAVPGSLNVVYTMWQAGTLYDVMDPAYANQEDPVSGARDTRIKHGPFTGHVSTFGDSVYQQLKYADHGADIRVSSWQESELILAEYHLLNGDLARAGAHLSRVRAAAGLPAFVGSTAEAVREQLLYERKTEFWLELRRWQDMRYYGIVPSRWSPAMQQAGVERRFPVSLRERSSNPHYAGR